MKAKIPPEKLSDFMKDYGEIRVLTDDMDYTASMTFKNKTFGFLPMLVFHVGAIDQEDFMRKSYRAAREGFIQGMMAASETFKA